MPERCIVALTFAGGEQTTVCGSCGQPLDDATIVVVQTSDGEEIARHRRCHMLELLDRA